MTQLPPRLRPAALLRPQLPWRLHLPTLAQGTVRGPDPRPGPTWAVPRFVLTAAPACSTANSLASLGSRLPASAASFPKRAGHSRSARGRVHSGRSAGPAGLALAASAPQYCQGPGCLPFLTHSAQHPQPGRPQSLEMKLREVAAEPLCDACPCGLWVPRTPGGAASPDRAS